MTKKDFEAMKAAVAPFDTDDARAAYAKYGLSAMRYRWDLLYRSKFSILHMYNYLNDDHIDTALKAIVP